MRFPFLLCGLSLLTTVLFAQTTVVGRDQQTFLNPNCALSDTCSLREFSLIVETKRTRLSSGVIAYATDARYVVKTRSVSELEDYALVQYIKGCQYSTKVEGGVLRKSLDVSRHYFDGMIVFKHPEWSIDSDTSDPVYTAWQGNRFGLYRWNQNPASYTPEGATFYARRLPPHPVVFATDMPGSFSAQGNSAKNSSLEFEMCLFRTRDLPLTTTPAGEGVPKARALKCFSWESKFTFDFNRRDYRLGGQLDPICLGAE
jgi:hypothetical protein